MGKNRFILSLMLTFSVCAGAAPDEIAQKLHFSSIVIDTHDDTTQRLMVPGFDLRLKNPDGDVDIPRMKEGGLSAIFFSIWVPGTLKGPAAVKKALDQIDAVREQARKNAKDLVLATTAEDVEKAKKEKKIAVLMGVEGGHMIDNDLATLRSFAALGVRYMTLTHSYATDWADSSSEKAVHNGLTDFGREVVREMNRLGMMVDVSHVSDKTFWDALTVSKAPLIASHSSCRALCNVPRNMSDDMMRALGEKGGVIQINFHVGFLSQEFADAEKSHPEIEKKMNDTAKKECGDVEGCAISVFNRITRQHQEDGILPKVNFREIVDHIDHAVKIAGIDHVGLGSDFDGAVMPAGMEDVTKLPKLTEELHKRGYTNSEIQKILGGNTLRLMRAVEKVKNEMAQLPERHSYRATKPRAH